MYFKITDAAKDLGCDNMQGSEVRRIPVFQHRCHKAALKGKAVKTMLKSCPAAKKLALTGVKPVIWGHQAVDIPPAVLKGLRSTVVGALGIRKPGGCATTAMTIHGYLPYDPLVSLRTDVVVGFLEAVSKSPLKLSLQHKWDHLLLKLNVPERWRKVTGPASATIATLLDVGWMPPSLSRWKDSEDCNSNVLILNFRDPCLAAQCKEAFY